MGKNEMTYERLVQEAKMLRHQAEQADAKFFVFLVGFERDHEVLWKTNGRTAFDQVLLSSDLLQPARYLLFRAGFDRVGVERALENGAHWTMEVGKRDLDGRGPFSDSDVGDLDKTAKAFREVHKTMPSEQVTKDWARSIPRGGSPRVHRVRVQANELGRLRAENTKLRVDLASARKRISELEQELSRLRIAGPSRRRNPAESGRTSV